MHRCTRVLLFALALGSACAESQDLPGPSPSVEDAATAGPTEAGVDVDAATPGPADLGAPDAADLGDLDAEPADEGAETDVGVADAGTGDAGEVDVGASDSGRLDVGTTDAGAGCTYVLVDSVIVECPAGFAYARSLRGQPPGPSCPDQVELSGTRYPDLTAAIAGEGCNPTCVWRAAQSVSFIDHCQRRNGYIIFRAADPQCPDLYEFSNGLFPSVDAWTAATPC